MSADPAICFRMAKLNRLGTPAGWARFIDELYGGERRNSVKEIVRLTIEAALDAGYDAGIAAVTAKIRQTVIDLNAKDQFEALDADEVRELLLGMAEVTEQMREAVGKMRPPAPDEGGAP